MKLTCVTDAKCKYLNMEKTMSLRKPVALLSLLLVSTFANAEIKIGAPMALSGSVAELAADMKAGAALAAKHVNAQGGVLGDTYELLFRDSACDPDKAVEVVKALVEENGVSALVGPVCSGATLRQAQSVSIPAGVVTLSVASASHLITNLRDRDLVFRTALSDSYKGEAMAAYVFEQGVSTLSVSFASDAYNTSLAKVFTKAYEALGGTVVINQVHQPDKSDYKREVKALAGGSENLALFAYYGSSGTELLKDVAETGKIEQVFGSDGLLSPVLIETIDQKLMSRTQILTTSADETRHSFKTWQSLAEEEGIPPSGPFVANSYDAAFMMALAIEAAQSSDRDAISKGLRLISGPEGEVILPGEFAKAKAILGEGGSINYDGASGTVDFDAKGDIAGFVSVNRVVNGAWEAQLMAPQ